MAKEDDNDSNSITLANNGDGEEIESSWVFAKSSQNEKLD